MLPDVVLALTETTTRTVAGAAAGGLLGAILTLTITGWRERRKIHAEDIATARLIEVELGNAQRAAENILTPDAAYTSFPITAWEQGRVRLARLLDPVEWLLIANAYDAVHGFNWRYQHDQELGDKAAEADKLLADYEERADVCRKVLEASEYALPILRGKL